MFSTHTDGFNLLGFYVVYMSMHVWVHVYVVCVPTCVDVCVCQSMTSIIGPLV